MRTRIRGGSLHDNDKTGLAFGGQGLLLGGRGRMPLGLSGLPRGPYLIRLQIPPGAYTLKLPLACGL